MSQTVPFEQLVGGLLSVGDNANPQLVSYNYGICPATGVRNGAGDVSWTLAQAADALEHSIKVQVRGTTALMAVAEWVSDTVIRTRVFLHDNTATDAPIDVQIHKVRRVTG